MKGKDFSEEALFKLNLEGAGMGEQSRDRDRQTSQHFTQRKPHVPGHRKALRDSRKSGGA